MNTALPSIYYEVRYDLSINALQYLYKETPDLEDAKKVVSQLEKEGKLNPAVYKILRVKMGEHLEQPAPTA